MSEHHRFQRNAIIAGENAPAADTRPEPGWVDTAIAGFRTTIDEIEDVQASRLDDAYQPVVEALRERGVERDFLRPWYRTAQLPFTDNSFYDRDAIWLEIERARAADPGAFRDVGTRAEFEREVRRRDGERDEDLETLSRGDFVPQLIGSIPAMYRDPVNLATGGIGGVGKTIATKVLTEGLVQAGIAAAQSGQVADVRAAMGEEYGTAEIAADIGLAFAGGAILRGGLELAPGIDSAAYRAAAPLRDAVDGRLVTRDVARALAEANPAGTLTPNQQAAVNVLTRAEEIDAASPFVDTYAARDAHAARLADAMEALDNGRIVPVEREAARLAALAPTRPADVASAAVTGDFDMGRYLARNRVAESGGDDTAAAATSSAYGRYQFVKDTWVEFYKRTFGQTGESRAAILAKRADGAVQDRVMQTFTQANAGALREAGVPVSDGTVYLAHFLGLRDAVKVLRATGETPIGSLVSRSSVRANRAVFDNVVTAAELVRWADRKMGSRTVAGTGPSPAAGARSAIDDALDAEEILIGVEEARLAGEDPLPVRFEPDPPELKRDLFASDTEWRIEQARLAAEAVGRDPAEDLLYRLRLAVEDPAAVPSLNPTAELAADLGTTPAALREGLERLVELGELRRIDGERFERPAPARGRGDLPEQQAAPIGAARAALDRDIVLAAEDPEELARLAVIGERLDEIEAADVARAAELPIDNAVAVWRANETNTATGYFSEADADMAIELGRLIAAAAGKSNVERVDVLEAASYVDQLHQERLGAALDVADADGALPLVAPDPETARAFESDAGEGVKATAESDWHDIRLLDEGADQLTFDLDDGRGPRTAAEIEAELAAERAGIEAMRGCL